MQSADFAEAAVGVDGHEVAYLESGAGEPVVVLQGEDGPGITPADELLAEQFRVLVLRSADPESVAAAVAALGIQRLRLIGSSSGARTAAELAARIGDRLDGLVLVGPPAIDAELEARLGDLEADTLVLFGTEDEVTPPELGRAYVELMPRCNLALVYAAGHAIEEDRPEAFADLVGDFLERGSGFARSRTSTEINP